MATIKRTGFGQVEPNHLSAQRTGRIWAQLPAKSNINILENGQFVKYDYQNKEVNYTGAGEWMLVYNEEQLYGVDRFEGHKDYAMKAADYTDGDATTSHYGVGPFPGKMYPRVFGTQVGDIYTTNCLGAANTSNTAKYAGIDVNVGSVLTPAATGYLIVGTGDMEWTVVEIYTMADGQPGVKLQRTK